MSTINQIKRLSYSSLKLLNENPSDWYKQYILKQRIDEYKDYFVVGKAFHLIVEQYNKKWIVNSEIGVKHIEESCKKYNHKEPIDGELKQSACLVDNYFYDEPIRAEEAELEIGMTMSWFPFIAILDAVYTNDWVIEDYKAVSKFTDISDKNWFEKMSEYYHQAGYYMIAFKEKYGTYPKYVQFTEVKKSVSNLMYSTKDNIIALCKDFQPEDSKLTKEKIIEKYNPRPIGKNIIKVHYNSELIDIVTKKIDIAIYNINLLDKDNLLCPFGKDTAIQDLILNNK